MKSQQTFLLTEKITTAFLMHVVKTANLFSSYIVVEISNTTLNVKSLLSMSALNGYRGSLVVIAVGTDSKEALETLSNYFLELQKRTI
ncbi:HPr family phosphocarrier protein [Alkalihalobacillus sp. CinArs1]|uniref:HPr family phosphocarrier protein n=1 Tax=Alkalihalobacillus sp. CinArs1 TaxID=2995314 RepID=UPI0022DDEF94|nr:HPr family phosphocarrier protein [Alkalihalobacillus sp. CinArs1]